jgi:hypothetical protein
VAQHSAQELLLRADNVIDDRFREKRITGLGEHGC